MTHNAVSLLLRFLAGFVAGLAVLAGFGFWLLSRGPISLDAVAPLVAATMSRGTGVVVAIDHTALSLGDGGLFLVFARGVHLRREGGEGALTLGDLTLEFSPRAALRGVIAPTRIVVNQPELRLDRSPDGSFHLGVGDLGADAAEDWGQKLVGDLVHPPDRQGSLGYLTELVVRNASLTVQDRALGLEWRAADAEASLTRASDRTGGKFRITAGQGAGETRLEGDFTFLPALNWLVVRTGFSDLTPSMWADAAPALAGLAALDAPISGELRAEFDPAQLTLRDAIANLTIGKGALRQAGLVGGALAIGGATLQGGYDAAQGRINLGLLSLDLDPGAVSLSGTISGVGNDLLSGVMPQAFDADLTLAGEALRLADFPHLWPESAAVSTRDWVTQHIPDGVVDALDARLDAHVDLSPAAAKPAEIRQFGGTMKFTGLSVEYFRPLPPVKHVTGTARFDRTEIEFKAGAGDVGNIHATAATARFYQLDTHDEQAKITVSAQGPLADALSVLDTPPLYYAREIGLDPKRAAGNFVAALRFDFPLLNHLPLKDVAYGADATLSDVGLGAVMFGRDLTNGALTLKLDPMAAQVDGTAQLAGAPLTLSWKQSLQPNARVRTHYGVTATLDEAQRQALGFDFVSDMVGGPVAVAASFDLAANKSARVVADLDLKSASIDVKKMNWSKAAGIPATAQMTLDLVDDKVTNIRDATIKSASMDAKLAASFDDQGISSITIDHVIGGDNDFSGNAIRDLRGGWRITAAGKSFDAAGLVDELDKAPPSEGAEPPLAIDATLDRLRLGPQREARALILSLVSDGLHWQQASIDANLSDTTSAKLRFSAEGDRAFTLTSDDFGALLKLLGIYDDIVGGRFALAGHAEDRGARRVLVTKADGSDYRVVRAPALARLLSLASFSGINALLTGQGIPFNRLQGDIVFETGKISLSNARAYGGAIGINASGVIDRAAGQINISGTLVPAYTLNSVIGSIPVLGDILVGGAGQGVFASNFRLYGPIDEPQISVNALSTLAPGFLRNLFLFSPSGP
jgi:hypothetical protein